MLDFENNNFASQLFSAEKRSLIGIKRESNDSPNLSKAQTSLNSDIMRNFCLRKNSNPRGSQITLQPRVEINKQNGGKPKCLN